MQTREFCEMVKKKRQEKYKTGRDFIRDKSLSCTYAYYSKIEGGTLPDIAIALEIIDKLKINSRKALYAWVRDQMPSSELKSFFSELDDGPSLSSEQLSADRSLVINRMQAQFLMKNPVYWEIMVFISTYHSQKEHTVKEIAKAFSMKVDQIEKMLQDLYDFGLLDKGARGTYTSKEWMFIPYEEEFKPLRDVNFRRAFDQFCKADPSTQFRTTITCLLLPRHQKLIESKVLALTNFIVDLTGKEGTADASPYTIGLFSSPRKFGNA